MIAKFIYIFMLDILRRKAGAFDTKIAQFISSGWWATLSFLIVWPLETLKSLIQAETKDTGKTWLEKSRYMIMKYGYTGLYRGLVPGWLSIFLRNGSSMVAMQYAHQKFTDHGYRQSTKS